MKKNTDITDEQMYNHLLFEFGIGTGKRKINESRGVVDSVNDFLIKFLDEVQGQITAAFSNRCTTKHEYEGNTEKYGCETFFKEFRILLSLSAINEERLSYNGGFEPFNSFFEDEEGNVICRPSINLRVLAASEIRMRRCIAFSLGHELTHAYNTYRYAQKYGINSLKRNILRTQNYGNLQHYSSPMYSHNTQAMAGVLYGLNRMERNAYIAQLRQEMAADAQWIKSAEDAMEVLKTTDSYERFKLLEKNVETILGERYEPVKKEILDATNAMIRDGKRKPFSNWHQLTKYFSYVWEDWKKKYLIMASKIAYDISARKNMELDGDLMNKKINLKVK